MSIRQGIHSMSPSSSLRGTAGMYKRSGSVGTHTETASNRENAREMRSGTIRMSKHIDEKRHQIAELEREKYWVQTESESLRKQILSACSDEVTLLKLEEERKLEMDLLQQNTDALVAYCSSAILSDACIPTSYSPKNLTGSPSSSHSIVCAAILDAPLSGNSVEGYLEQYERGMNILLSRPYGSIRIVYACGDESEDHSLRVVYSIDSSSQEILLHRLQDYLAGKYKATNTDAQFMLEVTKSIVLDLDMVIDKSVNMRQNGPSALYYGQQSNRDPLSAPISRHSFSESKVTSAVRTQEPSPVSKLSIPPLGLQKADTPSDHSIGIEAIPIRPGWGRRANRSDACTSNYLQAFPRNS